MSRRRGAHGSHASGRRRAGPARKPDSPARREPTQPVDGPVPGGREAAAAESSPGEIRIGPLETLEAGLVILAAVLLAFGSVVVAGRSLLLSDNFNPLDPRPLAENYGPGFRPPSDWHDRGLILYPNLRDPGATWWQWEPAAVFLAQSLADGELPFWDPYLAAGTPSMANLIPAHWFPPHLLVVLLGNSAGLNNLYFLALVFSAGLFTYLVLRKHGLSRIAALVGGVGFALSGGMVQTLGSFMGQPLASLPVALYVTRRYADRPTAGRAAALALVYAAVSLASFPPILVVVFTVAGAYGLTMTLAASDVVTWSQRWRRAGGFLAAAALAFALVAFYYLPALALFHATPQVAAAYQHAGLQAWIWESLYQLTSPVLMGGAQVYQEPLVPGMQHYYLPYVGVSILWLAGLAHRGSEGRRGPLFAFAALTVLLLIAKIVGVAPLQWLGALPTIRQLHIAVYFGTGLAWPLAALAAMGVEGLRRGGLRRSQLVWATVLAVVVACSLFELAHAKRVVGWPPTLGRWLVEWLVAVGFLGAGFAVAWTGWRARARPALCAGLAVVALLLTAGEGIRNATYPRQVRGAEAYTRPPAYVRESMRHGELVRTMAYGGLACNTNSAFRVPALDSLMAANPPRMFELYRRYANPRASYFLRGATLLPPEPVLDAAAVGLLSIRKSLPDLVAEAAGRGHGVSFDDEYVRVYQRATEPRFYFTSDYVTAGGESALERVGLPRRPRQIVLEQIPAGAVVPNPRSDPAVKVRHLGRNTIELAVSAPRPGWLYCADTFFTGWTATVDGVERPILPANHAFRALQLGPGEHLVRLSYWPPGLTAGLAVSALALLAVTTLAAGRRWWPLLRGTDGPPARD